MIDRPHGHVRVGRRAALLGIPALIGGYALSAPDRDQPAASIAARSAASPPATPVEVGCPAAGEGLIGCWVVSDIAAFIESGLMDVTGVQDLAYVAAEGTLAFSFSPEGAVSIIADRYRVAVSATVRLLGTVDTAVAFDGQLSGRYTLTGEELAISDLTRKDLIITADTPLGSVGIDNDDVFAGGASRLVRDPAGATMRLYPDTDNEAAIVLTRA